MLVKVADTIKKYSMLSPGSRVLVGVSGGIDSMTLLYILKKLGYETVVAHFNHGVRGAESDGDEHLVRDYCAEHGLEFVSVKYNMAEIASGCNFQDMARQMRYDWLEKQRRAYSCCALAVAHHQKDQGETILLHLLRGSGLRGLCGMNPVQGEIIRPFLFVSKDEIVNYAKENAIPWRDDASNFTTHYTRNKIRLDLWQQLCEYNQGLEQTLSNTGLILNEYDDYMKQQVAILLPAVCRDDYLDINSAALEHKVMFRLLVREFIRMKTGIIIDFVHTQRLCELGNQKQMPVGGGYYALNDSGKLRVKHGVWIFDHESPDNNEVHEYPVQLGIFSCDEFNYEIYVEGSVSHGRRLPEKGFKMMLPLQYLPQLKWRTRCPGDVIRPHGMNGSKKIKDLFIENKIPREQRAGLPLLCMGNNIIWVPGCRISDEVISFEGDAVLLQLIPKDKIGKE